MNQLPIIGLRGTFLGIIIGVLNIWFNIISIDTYNEEYYTLARYIIPLLFQLVLPLPAVCGHYDVLPN
jgi:hypothetical protein